VKSEDLLRYDAEYEAMKRALGARLLVFAWPTAEGGSVLRGAPAGEGAALPRAQLLRDGQGEARSWPRSSPGGKP